MQFGLSDEKVGPGTGVPIQRNTLRDAQVLHRRGEVECIAHLAYDLNTDGQRLQMAGTAADECQLPSIPNIDDDFLAPRSLVWLSSHAPQLPVRSSNCQSQS